MSAEFSCYIVRHTSVGVAPNVCYGQLDVPLSGDFDQEKTRVRSGVFKTPEIVLSSPLYRCSKLAEYLAHDQVVRYDDRLKELSFGSWEGKNWGDLDPKETETWMQDFVNNHPPKGESFYDLYQRVESFWTDLLELNQDVLIVTHQGVIKSLLACLTGADLKYAIRFKVSYGGITHITVSGEMIGIDYINRIG